MPNYWKRYNLDQEALPHIDATDEIYYLMEYIGGRDYRASMANNHISNFKKTVDRRGKPEWQHKERAIRQFARDLSNMLREDGAYVFASIPSSIARTDTQYDSRMDDMLDVLKGFRPNVIIERPLTIRETCTAAHLGGSRCPQVIYDNLLWLGFQHEHSHVILVDDVITHGGHFSACKRIILEHHPGMDVIGVFWAKTIWESPFTPVP